MPTSQERVASAMRFFFERALPQATRTAQAPNGKTFAELPSPKVHLGAYVRHAGGPVPTSLGQTVTPQYALRVSPELPVAGGLPNPQGAAVAGDGPVRHILWARHVADAAVDDEAEIQRVMGDLDTFAELFTAAGGAAPAGGTGAPPSGGDGGGGAPGTGGGAAPGASTATAQAAAARAADWARAVVAGRAALGVNLATLTEIPAALREVTDDLAECKQVLQHFFTYGEDGAYYRRWAGAGREPGNPAHLTPEYKQHNVREVRLERRRVYAYAVVPESLLSGGADLGQGMFREVVIRFDETGEAERPFTMATLHTARWRRNHDPHADFVFFYAEEGDGLPVAPEIRDKLSPQLIAVLGELELDRQRTIQSSPFILMGTEPQIAILATVEGEPQLPAGVIAETEAGRVRTLLVPASLDKIVELAALPQIRRLSVVPPVRPLNDQARTMVNEAGLLAKMAADRRGGVGVVVGVIDSGIDGSHPAFTGRIHAYWDQATDPAHVVLPAGNNPRQNNPTNAAYAQFNFGRELTGAATSGARDTNGHGTHVAGTAAGAEVRNAAGAVLMPAGLAPRATIVAVRAIDVGRSNYLLGIQYIIQKATELGRPCVINMSFGEHFHPHDGTDARSRRLVDFVTNAAGAYRQGRILVAAAGNDRGRQYHVRRPLPPRGTRTLVQGALQLPVQFRAGLPQEQVNIWIRNPNPSAAAGTAFPLSVWVFRFRPAHSRNTPASVTRLVPLGQDTSATPNGAGTFAAHRMRVDVVSSLADPINGDFNIQVLFTATSPPLNFLADTWVIALDNNSTQTLDVHAWIATAPSPTMFLPQGMFVDDDAFLIGVPATSPAAVGVASVNSRIAWTNAAGNALTFTNEAPVNELSTFSSPGPLRPSSIPIATVYPNLHHEFNGVDVAAPGCRIQSALSSQATPDPNDVINPRSFLLQGTSMASPVITGMVANLLAHDATLTLPQVLTRLRNASRIPAASQFQPPAPANPYSQVWGYGLVNGASLIP